MCSILDPREKQLPACNRSISQGERGLSNRIRMEDRDRGKGMHCHVKSGTCVQCTVTGRHAHRRVLQDGAEVWRQRKSLLQSRRQRYARRAAVRLRYVKSKLSTPTARFCASLVSNSHAHRDQNHFASQSARFYDSQVEPSRRCSSTLRRRENMNISQRCQSTWGRCKRLL